MTDDEFYTEIIDALVEQYTQEELRDYEVIKLEMGLDDAVGEAIWAAALAIKALRDTEPDWRRLLAIN